MAITRVQHHIPAGTIDVFRIINGCGHAVELSSLGAGVLSVEVPDRYGHLANVALGYLDPADYLADGPCMGKIPGRYANRIARGELRIGSELFKLPVNNGPNHLHGGPDGFQNRIWMSEELSDGIRFTLLSPDGDSGYPGSLDAAVEYHWHDDDVLDVVLSACTDRPTAVNLTNHTYWNLRGADSGSVLDHTMLMKASRYLPTDDTLIPTGEIAGVEGTPMDFTVPKSLGRDIGTDFAALRFGKGYDSCWVVDGWLPGRFEPEVVALHDPESGRVLTVGTDQPGVQIYTGNWLDSSPLNRSGRSYRDYEGVAIEAQGFPDAPNHAESDGVRDAFPGQILFPGEIYRRRIRFAFSVAP